MCVSEWVTLLLFWCSSHRYVSACKTQFWILTVGTKRQTAFPEHRKQILNWKRNTFKSGLAKTIERLFGFCFDVRFGCFRSRLSLVFGFVWMRDLRTSFDCFWYSGRSGLWVFAFPFRSFSLQLNVCFSQSNCQFAGCLSVFELFWLWSCYCLISLASNQTRGGKPCVLKS